MLDSIGIVVLQLDLVVVQQPPKKFVGGGGEPLLMKAQERDDIAIKWRWHVLLAGQPPLVYGPRAEKTATDEALHALEHDVRMAPLIL